MNPIVEAVLCTLSITVTSVLTLVLVVLWWTQPKAESSFSRHLELIKLHGLKGKRLAEGSIRLQCGPGLWLLYCSAQSQEGHIYKNETVIVGSYAHLHQRWIGGSLQQYCLLPHSASNGQELWAPRLLTNDEWLVVHDIFDAVREAVKEI